MGDYFRVMSADGDIAAFFTEDVTWVNVESGQQFRGRAAVRNYIRALHDRLYESAFTRTLSGRHRRPRIPRG
jgi:ketosteroid isomerase-like protein